MKNIIRNLQVNLNELDYLEKILTLQVSSFLRKNKNLKDFYKRIEIPNIIAKFPKVIILKLTEEEEGSYSLERTLKFIRKTKKEIEQFMLSLKEVTSYISLTEEFKDEVFYKENEDYKSEELKEIEEIEEIKKPKFKKPEQDHNKSCSMLELAHIEAKLTRIFEGVEQVDRIKLDSILNRKRILNLNIINKQNKIY